MQTADFNHFVPQFKSACIIFTLSLCNSVIDALCIIVTMHFVAAANGRGKPYIMGHIHENHA